MARGKGRDFDLTSMRASDTELNGPKEALPSEARLLFWNEQFWEWPEHRRWLDSRGLSVKTAKAQMFGYREASRGREIKIPVIDPLLGLINVKTRFLDEPDPSKKYRLLTGHGASLYPCRPSTEDMIVTEGEFDCLILKQHGFDAITQTGGMGHWDDEWGIEFVNRSVSVIYDVPTRVTKKERTTSYEYALELVEKLDKAGAQAVAVDLSLTGMKPGEDITDWFVTYKRTGAELDEFIDWSWNDWNNEQAA